LRRRTGVAAVEPDRPRVRTAAGDPLLVDQPYLQSINWTPPAPGSRPLVAVLDTGVDGATPDLRGRIVPRLVRSFIDDKPLLDRAGHGTHVAATIAAVTGNGIGIAGVANARILVVKIADAHGRATTSSLVRGIAYAVSRKARIINVSFGGSGFSKVEQDAILAARRAGALVVVAAGNSGRAGNRREYPGAYRHVLAVAAVRPDGTVLLDSTRGPQVAIAAPGKNILSAAPGGRYQRRTGTSMAAAVVSGAAARLLAQRPQLDASQLRTLLLAGARHTGPPGHDDATGWGLLDLAGALALPTPPPDGPEPNDDAVQAQPEPASLAGAGAGEAVVEGALEQWSDPRDDYRVRAQAGDVLELGVEAQPGAELDPDLVIWMPGAPAFSAGAAYARRWLAATSLRPGPSETLRFVVTETGVQTVEVQASAGRGRYRLTVRRTPGSAAPAAPAAERPVAA
jgi:subtilisin family serine protease